MLLTTTPFSPFPPAEGALFTQISLEIYKFYPIYT
jgi:hypothetical protein